MYVCILGIIRTTRMKYLWIIIFSVLSLSLTAQRMRVEDFARYKKPFIGKASFTTDKKFAQFDLFTNEKGFQFYVGTTSVPITEGEGFVTLTLPHHTSSLTVKHPDYGQIVWKVPGKWLKKKRHYHAYLYTESLKKEYQQEKQWAVFNIRPENVIVYVDSLIYPVQNGYLSLYLSLGQHVCRIESPFYKTLNDTFELTDSLRLEKQFELEPFYSYLTVETDISGAQILLDGQSLGINRVETGRLMPGRYRLTICRGDRFYYDQFIDIENAERKVVDLRNVHLVPFDKSESQLGSLLFLSQNSIDKRGNRLAESSPGLDLGYKGEAESDKFFTSVYIRAFDADTEIWLNREKVAKGEWQGELLPGFYAVSSTKDSLDSRTEYFWVEAGKKVELNLESPLADYGLLNISCDELDAEVYLNGVAVGSTPCVLRNLPVDRTYRVRLVKGTKIAEESVHLKGNDIMNLHMKLKKK